jgi:hypothetical protein
VDGRDLLAFFVDGCELWRRVTTLFVGNCLLVAPYTLVSDSHGEERQLR